MTDRLDVKGIYSAMMTPYDTNGRISEKTLEKFMEFFLEKKLDGIFPVSNVGEFAALTFEDKCSIIDICTEMGKGKLKICPGATDMNLDIAIKLAGYYKEKGADGVILSSPYYYPYSKEYIEEYIRVFIKESPLPVIFYHSPRFANPVEPAFLMEIIRNPKVRALKESSGDMRFLTALLEKIKRENIEVQVMVGWEELLLTGLVHGACGCITSCGGIIPEILKKILECWEQGDMEQALLYQQKVSRITEILSSYGFPGGYKMGMAARVPCRILQSDRMQELESKMQYNVKEIKVILEKELV